MKKNILELLMIGLMLIGLIACGGVSQKECETLKSENEGLKLEIEELRWEIEDMKFGPENLLSQAKNYINNKQYNKAKGELENLIVKYPTSQLISEAKQLIPIADIGIKEQRLAEEKSKLAIEKTEKDRLANATKKMRVKVDDMNEVTWYYDKTSPQFANYNGFYSYIGTSKGSKPWLRLVIQYAANDWLFIENYIIKVDGQTFYIKQNFYGEIKTDNGSGGIWEWLDRDVGNSEYQIIKAIANGKDVKIRFNGKDYYKDKTITLQQKTALRNVLDAYEALGGTEDF